MSLSISSACPPASVSCIACVVTSARLIATRAMCPRQICLRVLCIFRRPPSWTGPRFSEPVLYHASCPDEVVSSTSISDFGPPCQTDIQPHTLPPQNRSVLNGSASSRQIIHAAYREQSTTDPMSEMLAICQCRATVIPFVSDTQWPAHQWSGVLRPQCVTW